MISFDVLWNVYKIRFLGSEGTCFSIQKGEKFYVITARHMFFSLQDFRKVSGASFTKKKSQIQIFQNDKWKNYTCNVYFHENLAVDIAVIELIKESLPFHSLEIYSNNMEYGQDVFFMGFPLHMQSFMIYNTSPFPLPLVKKAVIAGMNYENGESIYYLDTQSNPGFSGGPIITKNNNTGTFQVFGVMSRGLMNGTAFTSKKMKMEYYEDCGITIVSDIQQIDSILDRIDSESKVKKTKPKGKA
jgi:hypothetical protein